MIVRCTPTDMVVVASAEGADKSPRQVPCGERFSMSGGTWIFTGTYGDAHVSATRDLRITREYEVELVIDVPVVASTARVAPDPPSDPDITLRTPPPRAPTRAGPLVALLGGFAAVVTAVVLDVVPTTAHNGELDGMDFVPLGFYLGGVTMFVIGVATW